jgi:hypothetical protein
MIMASNIGVVTYLAQVILLSAALGCWTYHLTRLLFIPGLSRFLIGFSMTPFVLGGWMLLIAHITPGAPRLVFTLPPFIIAVGLLVIYGPRTLHRLRRSHQTIININLNQLFTAVICIAALIIVIMVAIVLIENCETPLLFNDSLVYMQEALRFAEGRSPASITDYHGAADGSIRGDIHSFLYPAYLGQALLFNGGLPLGYPNDITARIAFQLTIFYMLLAVIALAAAARQSLIPPLALILMLQVPEFEYLSRASSRDGFRIIPLVLLVTVLTGLTPRRLCRKLRLETLLLPLFLSFCALAGHTLGAYIIVTLALAWGIWNLAGKARWLNIILVAGALGIGLILGSLQYIQVYRETGTLTGDIFKESVIEGTPLWEESQQRDQASLEGTRTLWERLVTLIKRDGGRLSIFGLVVTLFSILWFACLSRQRWNDPLPFWSLATFAAALPFLGVFDFSDYPLSLSFVANFRYALHWYPFAAVCIALFIVYGYQILSVSPQKPARIAAVIMLLSFSALAAFDTIKTVNKKWVPLSAPYMKMQLADNLSILQTALDLQPEGKRLLLDDEAGRYNYYLNNKAVIIYTRPTWEIVRSRNQQQIDAEFDHLDIGSVVLTSSLVTDWWDRLALYRYLNNPERAIDTGKSINLQGYVVKNDEVVRKYQDIASQAFNDTLLMKTDFTILEENTTGHQFVTNTGQSIAITGTPTLTAGLETGEKALVLDGNTSLAGSSDSIGSEQGSLSLWIRFPVGQTFKQMPVAQFNENKALTFTFPKNGKRLALFYNGIKVEELNLGKDFADGQWRHLVFAWNRGEQRLYVDGVLISSRYIAATAPMRVQTFTIGHAILQGKERWMTGDIAALATFKRTLTPAEVSLLFKTGLLN